MGNYAECWLDSLYVGSSKNDIDPNIMSLFRSSDKNICRDRKSQLPECLKHWLENNDNDEEFIIVYYIAEARKIKDRLNLIGYTAETSGEIFDISRKEEINHFKNMSKSSKTWIHYVKLLKSMNIDVWISTLEKINKRRLNHRGSYSALTNNPSIIDYMLEHDWYGFPGPDLSSALRMAIEALPSKANLVYDITDLVRCDYFKPDDDFVEISNNYIFSDYYSKGKTIVLTEGRSDSFILSESLKLLFPHLDGYFTFMDFESANVGGGVGNLSNIIKAFSGTGIINKVIALFDNDTAAKAAINGLRSTIIPENIKIIQLPEYGFLRKYPTIGPSGKVAMDINNIAGSIELYLGRDVLKDKKGDYYCVQWTGYDQGVEKYQGEIINKNIIFESFSNKISICKKDKKCIKDYDWEGIQLIFRSIFTLFNMHDKEDILLYLKKYYNN